MFDGQSTQGDWEADLIGLNRIYLSQLRAALREEFVPALRAFGLKSKRFGQQLEALDQPEVDRLAASLTVNFLNFDEQAAIDMLVESSVAGPLEPEVRLKVRESTTSTSSWSQAPAAEVESRWDKQQLNLRLCYLMTMRAALRDDLIRGACAFGLSSRRFALALRSMGAAEILNMAGELRGDFISCRDSLPIEVLMDRLPESCGEIEVRMAVMAHAAASLRNGSSFFEGK